MFKHVNTLEIYATSRSLNEKGSSISLPPDNEAWEVKHPKS